MSKSYFNLIKKVELAYKRQLNKKQKINQFRVEKILISVACIALLLSFVCMLIYKGHYLSQYEESIKMSALTLVLVSYILVIILMLYLPLKELKNAVKFSQLPIISLVDSQIKPTMALDSFFLTELKKIPREKVELGLSLLILENKSLNKRVELVFGAFKKTGLFFGLLSIAIPLFTKIDGHDYTNYFYAFSIIYIVMFIMCVFAESVVDKYDKYIQLTQLFLDNP
ncbi:hypothetical protein [Providencia rettgeri]|uniref:hypothetical protein n=1 Tax=Providencia rettgeri TaxID=587 RepID=UPI00141A267C|nr:hypothetical protein [Providencia rettgeri]NIH07186.1 hypothetical protein [Providencia rettgeri]